MVKSHPGNFVILLCLQPKDSGLKQGEEVIPAYDSKSIPSSSVDQQPLSCNLEPLQNATANQNGYGILNALEPIVTESSTLLNLHLSPHQYMMTMRNMD